MAAEKKHPFQSFSFWMIEGRRPRVSLRLAAPAASQADGDGAAGELFTLTVQKGSAANPTSKIERQVPLAVAERLRDGLQRIGAFGWEGSYGDESSPGSLRWAMAVVFQEGVFSLEAKGGSDVPPRFGELLEELYALDLPRSTSEKPQGTAGVGRAIGNAMGVLGVGSIGGMTAGDLGAYAATKGADRDFSYLGRLFGASDNGLPEGLEGFGDFDPGAIDPQEAARLFAEMQQNPQAMQEHLREEFRQLPPDQQGRMLDALAGLGFASRAWWERFFGL